MEAANLSVSITGNASGLLAAVSTANAALAGLAGTANAALAGIQDKTVKVTAIDNTAAGVASARAAINSLSDKTVTVTVQYQTVGSPPKTFAQGTASAPGGLALVNDERGIRDPRELIYHDGQYMMYQGRDVIVPLAKGDRVYTAAQTKAIMEALGIPSYARGLKNERFQMERDNFKSLTKSSNVPIDEQIAWWQDAVERFSYDYEVVKECNEEIFSLTRKLADNINDLSGVYIEERTHFNDWETYGDNALAAFERVKENNRKFLDDGFITYSEYVENVKKAGEDLYEGRIEQSEDWLEQQRKYNGMSTEEYIAGLERMADYTKEYFANGIIDYREYAEGLQEINNDIFKARGEQAKELQKQNAADYKHWESDAANWKKMRDTYGDWDDYGDSHIQFYERCIERVKEFYEAGKIDWQQYMDDTFDYQLKLYKAQEGALDEAMENALKDKRDYIADLKDRFRTQEDALKRSWDEDDRSADMADIRKQIGIYSHAVTNKGREKYEELQARLKQLQREEEIAELEAEHNRIIERLEKELAAAETNKRGLLTSLNSYGMSTNQLVGGIVADVQNMRGFLSDMFAKLINAVESSARANSYTDNSSKTYYNVGSGAKAALDALAASIGRSFIYKY